MTRYKIKDKTMPLIPLRGMIVYPGMVTHFDVGRDKSLKAIEEAQMNDSKVFLVPQKDFSLEDPAIEDIYSVGCICEIKQNLKLPGSTTRVLVEGLERAEILEIQVDDFYTSKIREHTYTYNEEDLSDKERAIMRIVVDNLKEYLSHNPQLAREALVSLTDIEDPSKLADLTASYLDLKLDKNYEILSEFNIYDRLENLHKILQEEIELSKIEQNINQKVKDNIDKSQKDYFLREQLNVIKDELGDYNSVDDLSQEYYKRIEEVELPDYALEKAMAEADKLATLSPASPEVNISITYLDYLLDLPWNKYTESDFDIKDSKEILEEDHYGLKDVKERVFEHLAVMTRTEDMAGSIICLTGPPGVGKTSIAKSIARATGRNFVSMRLGGVRDEAEIRGHRKTYIGAMPGRIITQMTKADSMNPVFLLDEIDKLGADYKGDPSSALLEVLDPEQNDEFTDHFLEIPFDLSDVMFITTSNDTSLIPDALRDRMEIIEVSSYTAEEKLEIGKRHLWPKQLKKHGLGEEEVKISDNAFKSLIQDYTREAGVREFERTIAKVLRKSITFMLENDKDSVSINKSNLEKFAGKTKHFDDELIYENQVGVVTGLAWTRVGGEILQIEANIMPGSGKVQLTGQLGDVMKESAMTGASYVRSNAKELGIKEENFYKESDIHVHVPEGAVPKDGPSAGAAMATAMVSSLTGKKIDSSFAMTGEITLTGRILRIGGVKEKVLAAKRYKIKNIILPQGNKKDVEDLESKTISGLKFYYVKDIKEVIDLVLKDED